MTGLQFAGAMLILLGAIMVGLPAYAVYDFRKDRASLADVRWERIGLFMGAGFCLIGLGVRWI